MNLKIGLFATLVLTLSACSTIHFDRTSNVVNSQKTYQQWHHNFAFALYEGSKPVNLVEICPNDNWQSVQTEVSFLNGLAAIPVNLLGPLWYPKTIDVICASN